MSLKIASWRAPGSILEGSGLDFGGFWDAQVAPGWPQGFLLDDSGVDMAASRFRQLNGVWAAFTWEIGLFTWGLKCFTWGRSYPPCKKGLDGDGIRPPCKPV